MSAVIVSHVPRTVSAAKLQLFFAFCGSIKSVNELGSDANGYQKFQVTFELEKALSTALLLNDAELDSIAIVVTEEKLPTYSEVPSKEVGGDHKVQYDDTKTGDQEYDDISQEEKPKLAILAQLLALGYKVSDDLIDRAVKIDNQKGYSSKFKSFLSDLDSKYLHSQDPQSSTSRNLNKAQVQINSLSTTLQNLSYRQKLQHYFDKAATHPYGLKVNEFYQLLTKEVQDVHKEATRLYNLKKAEASTQAPAEPASEEAAGLTEKPVLSEKPVFSQKS